MQLTRQTSVRILSVDQASQHLTHLEWESLEEHFVMDDPIDLRPQTNLCQSAGNAQPRKR